jgi:hypothetical protein
MGSGAGTEPDSESVIDYFVSVSRLPQAWIIDAGSVSCAGTAGSLACCRCGVWIKACGSADHTRARRPRASYRSELVNIKIMLVNSQYFIFDKKLTI